jgi:cell division protein FtsB
MESKIALIFLGIILVIFIYNLFGLFKKMQETAQNKKNIEDKITELEKSKENLDESITKLNTDKGVEESIRDKFGLAKEGEGMILVVDDKNAPAPEKKDDSSGFFSFFTNLFK